MLYVALTRARDHLILTGKSAKPDELLDECALQAQYADEFRVQNAGNYLNWTLDALSVTPLECAKITIVPAAKDDQQEESPEEPAPNTSKDTENSETQGTFEPALLDELRSRFTFTYGDDSLRRIPTKLTVSRLNPEILDGEGGGITLSLDETPEKSNENPEESPESLALLEAEDLPESSPDTAEPMEGKQKRPLFMTGGRQATAADRGSATHVFLQFVNYENLRANGVQAEIDRLKTERYLSAEMAELIHTRQIERFRESALLDALLRSDLVKREFRFNVLLPSERFTRDPEFAAKLHERGIQITVQGVVDCVYRDPDSGKLVLVDYKTDSLTAEEWRNPALAEEKLIRRHRDQLTYYREICAEMFEEPIEKAVIYSTVLGRCIEVR